MSVYYQDERITLLHGDALEETAKLGAGSVQTVVTSPPYFGLRDYGEDGQYGAEPHELDFVDQIVDLFHEIRRVLADDGTAWLNLGDSYEPKTKSLRGIPWQVALALREDGWVLRSDIIWHKPNAMPESVTDRPTKAHEHLFLLAKRTSYYYDAAAVKVPVVKGASGSQFHTGKTAARTLDGRASNLPRADSDMGNLRDVWTIPTNPFPGAHFATFPPALVRPCVRAGSRIGDTILDPFSGSGTTGMVALQEGRRYVGIDLNADYLDLSLRERFQEQPLDIYGGAA